MKHNRKRERSHQDYDDEFMPLSKRVNNLHLRNNLLLDNPQTINELGPGPPSHNSVQLPESPPESVQSIDQYNPELNEAQNPYYYNINKLLYEMYIARQQRNNL